MWRWVLGEVSVGPCLPHLCPLCMQQTSKVVLFFGLLFCKLT